MQRHIGHVLVGIIAGTVLIGIGFFVDSLIMILGMTMLVMNVVVNLISRIEAKEATHYEVKGYPCEAKPMEV